MEACELLDAELALDQLEAEIAAELPAHVRALARAYATGAPLPPAPASIRRPYALAVARRALVHGELFDRALDLVRILAPTAIADAIGPIGETNWASLDRRSAAADAAARSTWGIGFVELMHRLHGSAAVRALDAANHGIDPADAALAKRGIGPVDATAKAGIGPVDATAGPRGIRRIDAIPGWREPDGIRVATTDVERAFAALATRHGVAGSVSFFGSGKARPRTFLVEPGRELIVVIPASITTPQQRWATAHELGHAVAAFAARRVWPRVVDEAAAAYVARGVEHRDGELGSWFSEHARPAREQRDAYAASLDAIERALPPTAAAMATVASSEPTISASRNATAMAASTSASAMAASMAHPPRALFDDPGAQAAYVAAERLADGLEHGLGPTPATRGLAAALERLRLRIDGATRL